MPHQLPADDETNQGAGNDGCNDESNKGFDNAAGGCVTFHGGVFSKGTLHVREFVETGDKDLLRGTNNVGQIICEAIQLSLPAHVCRRRECRERGLFILLYFPE